MPSLLQELQKAAQQNPPSFTGGGAKGSAPTPATTPQTTQNWGPIKSGCVCGFIVLLIIAVVLVINRLHEQSHNANIVRVNEDDWKDLDVEKENPDPNFTPLSELVGSSCRA